MDDFLDGIFNWIFVNIITPVINFIGDIFGFLLSTGPSRIFFALLFLNLLGFYLMYKDKKIAKQNGQIKEDYYKENNISDGVLTKEQEKAIKRSTYTRVSERTLILIALLGGSLGILLGMKKFRHKTQKQLFTIGVPVIIAIHIVFIIWQIITRS